MYQALYRKYRPKTFDDVVGQDVIKRTIINSVKYDNLSHAYLFYGPRGTGKTSVAKLIAKIINCFNPIDGKPCGKCQYCLSLTNENLDVIEIDAASNNGVDEIRELKTKINIMPSLGKYKIYIIDEVHMLSIGAFNALLKTLEEPPKHVIFILATTEINKIPETIISRCQRLDFKRVSESSIKKRLKFVCESEKVEIDNDVLQKIARISNGGLRDAIGMLDKVVSYSPNQKISMKELNESAYITSDNDISKIIKCVQMFDIDEYLNIIDKLNNEGKNLISLVDELIIYIRNLFVLNKNIEHVDFFLNLINELNELSIKMKNSPYPKVLLELLIIKINKNKTYISQEKQVIQEENKNISQEINTFSDLKSVRINNTLFGANKTELAKLKNRWKDINLEILEEKYSKYLSFIPDLNIVAASESNVLLSSKYDSIIEKSLENFIEIEEIIEKLYNKRYKLMFITNTEWNKVKKEYVNNAKNNINYKYIDEISNVKDLLKGEMIK